MFVSHLMARLSPARTPPGELRAESFPNEPGGEADWEFLNPAHWESALHEVRSRFHEQRCQVLMGVHDMVLDIIKPAENFPEPLRVEYRKAAHALAATVDNPESALQCFAEATSSVAQWLNSRSQDEKGQKADYGGQLGHAIFNAVIDKCTIPTLKACLLRFSKDTNNLSYSLRQDAATVFLRALFDVAGLDRQIVAVMSDTEDSYDFGAVQADTSQYMCDLTRHWDSWQKMMNEKFDSIAQPAWRRYCARHSSPNFLEFLVSRQVSQNNRKYAAFLDHDKTMNLVYDMTEGQSGGGWLGPVPACDQISVYRFKWSATPAGDITISELECDHPKGMNVDAIKEISPYVLSALDWTPAFGIDDLKRSLAKILYTFSHSSTFLRGQASIVEAVMKSIALHHDLQLGFGEAWSRPDPQPDQHALAEFSVERFVANALPNLMLTPT
ncbi:hypothetical protein [Variovorax sp. PBL-E5]|uniref:hypothetical protein n=1 Tax=Variovorax sp. PBL-E5 TaxID=434014 RepID=UPI001318825A|nr:hypothetical protein [Variovorax sp. PBL-E5]VTU26522.1 hypothetical protein E5CHR_02213 [Variovorax sp. PBL-E5]